MLHFKGSCQSSHIPAIVCLCHSAGHNLPHVHTQTHTHRRAVKLHRVFREQTVFLVTNQSDSRTCDQALPRERESSMGSVPAWSQQPSLQAAFSKPRQDARRLAGRKRPTLNLSPRCNLPNPSGAPLSCFLETPHFKGLPVRKGQRVHAGLSC